MDFTERLHLIHLCYDSGIFLVHQFISDFIDIPQAEISCRKGVSAPGKSAVLGAQLFDSQQHRPVRINGNVLVKGQVIQDQIVGTCPAAPSGPAGLLPEGSLGSRVSGEYGCVYLADINAQLQSVGGNQAA